MDTIWFPDLSGAGARPKHQALGLSVREAIATGRLAPGDRLPPVREVAWKVGVTPGTVARAYKDLVDQGVLRSGVGKGTFVAEGLAAAPGPERADDVPYMMAQVPQGRFNLRSAQVAQVGQGAALAELMQRLPAPGPEDYRFYPQAGSDLALRQAMARRSEGPDHGEIAAEDVVLTLGAQHALVTAMMALLHGPRPVVLTEELAYPGIRHAAALLRAEVQGVRFDEEGPLPEALDRAAAETGAQIFVTSANTHNPTTTCTSLSRRRELAEVARARGLQIVEDDCFGYAEVDLPGYRLLAPERTWLVTSLSKSISPDLRLGALVGPEGRAEPARVATHHQFFGLPRPLRDLMTLAMESGVAAQIEAKVKAASQARVEMVRGALGRFGIVTRDHVPFAWLPMPRGWRASSFSRAAEGEAVLLKAADEFALIDGRAPNAVRLALTAVGEDADFAEALRRLSALLSNPPSAMEA
ncbi:PLP-dependent aminotransferase family protein [Pseudoroseicyclus tamaricis]|uniref:PLP-dependent aminotransferase family protein n=1 Tax=Pseudoroseicyclus tamaricis TaxID=2705421 RepID=A0A6B2JR24_9RHOB|nr:PLP-dependent aminotransferase family protein [Pseudoroseicyclus tamaricis]NDV00628.1 PLP-dependent aminotransferase family protein [Pseudoroseicyclus tamaricis]